ncbi:MAG: response regulator [Akkermansiaceae bacterium]|jgi:FixJ family two-component response regulator
MITPPDQLPAILFVDDEPKTCKHFARLFGPRFRIITAADGIEAMIVFKEQSDDIGIIMTDQRMPNETGTEFLEKAARLKPSVVRILSTAYADVDSAADAVNNSGIYRYITKPWEISELEMTLIRAMELYLLERDRNILVTKKTTELAQIAARERVIGFAALAVFKESGIRHVAEAISSLVQLANTIEPPIDLAQWQSIYQGHRKFFDLAHSAFPAQIFESGDVDHAQEMNAAEVCKALARNHPRLENLPATGASPSLPGPLATLTHQISQLINGFQLVVPDSSKIFIQETSRGITLGFPAAPVEQILLPLFSHLPVPENDLGPCLELATAILGWHHHGGQLQYSWVNDTLIANLSIIPFTEASDPWSNLAADLIGNSSFWERQR